MVEGRPKALDGILVQIALEKLRDRFPNKYVAIKTSKDNSKFIVLNNFQYDQELGCSSTMVAMVTATGNIPPISIG